MKVQLDDIPKNTDTPILTYCRHLMNKGFDPSTKLEVYRGDILAITVSSIKFGSNITVKENKDVGPHFIPYSPFKMPVEGTTSPSPIRV